MANITAAYNFAPVTKDDNVFSPYWAEQVSMEAPLKKNGQLDSYTGVITYDITAKTPIYIRSGEGDSSFTHVGNNRFIPGTTLKGCFRSVLEIISFGRMKGRVKADNPLGNRKVDQAIPVGLNKDEKPDFADLMFGYVVNKNALKGRVQVHHAFAENVVVCNESPILAVLGSPCTGFYPTYMQGFDKNKPLINGYKRYPVKNSLGLKSIKNEEYDQKAYKDRFPEKKSPYEFSIEKNPLIPRNKKRGNKIVNFKTLSLLEPLGIGSTFKGKITFFNLKKEELGALLCAMTFMGNEETCYHSIGSAKAMGFGAIKISKIEIKLRKKPTIEKNAAPKLNDDIFEKEDPSFKKNAMEAFKFLMDNRIKGEKGKYCARIDELIEMAKYHENMKSLNPPSFNKFKRWKENWGKNGDQFPRFSRLNPQGR